MWPTPPGSRPAPITATDRGASSGVSDRWAAWRSRASSAVVSASPVVSRTTTTPSENVARSWVPRSRATLTIGALVGQDLPDQFGDAGLAGAGGQGLQQQRADAPAVLGLGHDERELGRGLARAGARPSPTPTT